MTRVYVPHNQTRVIVDGPQAVVRAQTGVHRHQHEITEQLRPLFARHRIDNEELGCLIESRAARLAQLGETAASVRETLNKGEVLDMRSTKTAGFLLSAPFTGAGLTLFLKPDLSSAGGLFTTPAAKNAVAAALFVAYNSIGVGLLKRATSDTQWFAPQDKELEDCMRMAALDANPGALRSGMENAATVQVFTAKDAIAGLLRGAIAGAGERYAQPLNAVRIGAIATDVKAPVSSAGSAVSGLVMSMLQLIWDKHHYRVGPEFLLGAKDWEPRYRALKEYDGKTAAKNVLSRAMTLPLDIAQDLSKSMQSIFTPRGLVSEVVALGGGIAINELARSAVKNKALSEGWSPALATLAGDLAVAPGELLYFGAWAFFAKTIPAAAEYGDHLINKFRERGTLEGKDMSTAMGMLTDEETAQYHLQRINPIEQQDSPAFTHERWPSTTQPSPAKTNAQATGSVTVSSADKRPGK